MHPFANALRPRTLPKLSISGIKSFAPLRYEYKVRDWIQTLKFQMCLSSSHKTLLQNLADYMAPQLSDSYSGILAIPSHPIRSLCQVDLSWEWGLILSKVLKIPLHHNFLLAPPILEALFQAPQKELSLQERVQRSKQISRFRIHPQHHHTCHTQLLLIDDVLNTGSSFREALRLLESSGHHVGAACFLAITPQAEILS